MELKTQREILETLQKMAIEQAVLREKVESHLEKTQKLETELDTLKMSSATVLRHDFIIKGILWFYGVLITILGYHIAAKL